MQEVTVYEADDGTVYEDKAECERHDKELAADKNKQFFEASVESFAETHSQDDHDNDLLVLIRAYPKQFYEEVLAPIIPNDEPTTDVVSELPVAETATTPVTMGAPTEPPGGWGAPPPPPPAG